MGFFSEIMKKVKYILIFFIFSLMFSFSLKAKNSAVNAEKSFFSQEFGFFTGFSEGDIEGSEDYEFVLGVFRLGYNLNKKELGFTDLLKPVFDKFDIKPKGYTEFILEPFFNQVISPDSDYEAGFSIMLKYAYPLFDKVHLYGIGGGGLVYMGEETAEQSTQYNFLPQLGAGISFFVNENCSVSIEYRYRHLSNAGIKEPNRGINTDMFLTGMSWYY